MRRLAATLFVLLALVTSDPAPAVAAFTSHQQKCVSASTRALRTLTRAMQRELGDCIRDHNNGTAFSQADPNPVTDILACAVADRSGRIASARVNLARRHAARCTGLDSQGIPKAPDSLVADPGTMDLASAETVVRQLHTLYGTGEAGAETEAGNRPVALCQKSVATSLRSCERATLAQLAHCLNRAVRPGLDPAPDGATTAADAAPCFEAPPSARVQGACDDAGSPDRIRRALQVSCDDRSVPFGTAFPDCGTSALETTHACLRAPLACSSCLQIARSSQLAANCDAFDDGLDNLSCGCGDGVVTPAEECDDLNLIDGDGCSATCSIEHCGNGVIESEHGEECDDGNETPGDGCSPDCILDECGNDQLQAEYGEECDDGNKTSEDGCSASCQIESCGDGITQNGLGETCDDANATPHDGCTACQADVCGDGVVNNGGAEECDGTEVSACPTSSCSSSCFCDLTIFVTSSTISGDLGGLAGGHATCQALASAAGLSGSFKAWLSVVETDAGTVMTDEPVPYVRTDGAVVATSLADLTDGSVAAPLELDENGISIASSGNQKAWSHTQADGVRSPGDPCNAWTSSAPTRFATRGDTSSVDSKWTDAFFLNCDGLARLYCVQQ